MWQKFLNWLASVIFICRYKTYKEFKPIIAGNNYGRVVLEFEGEGLHGAFEPSDEDDEPQLRMSLYRFQPDCYTSPDLERFCNTGGGIDMTYGGRWLSVKHGSYLTRLSAAEPREVLQTVANAMFERVSNNLWHMHRDVDFWFYISQVVINSRGEPVWPPGECPPRKRGA